MKKSFKVIKQIVNILLIIFVICFALVVCLQRFSNNEISFLNFRLFTVVSGSMAPEYEIGDVLLAQERDPKEIKVGDNISYLGEVGNFKGKVVTHQVVEIEEDKEATTTMYLAVTDKIFIADTKTAIQEFKQWLMNVCTQFKTEEY